MKARPILFSGPMIRALLDGRKTQTRRVMKWNSKSVFASYSSMPPQCLAACPYGKTGDLLVVKESAWMWCERRANGKTKTGRPKWRYVPLDGAPIHYQADHREKPLVSITHPETGNQWGWRLKLGRFLPRKASRLTLELSEVRVERLLDISEADAIAEGVSEAAFRSGLTGGKYVPTDRPLHAMWCRKCQGQGVHGALGPEPRLH